MSMKWKCRITIREIYKWKARLNIQPQGKQEKGVHFWEMLYSPVVKWFSIHLLLFTALTPALLAHQTD